MKPELNPEAAETAQITDSPAVDVPRLVPPCECRNWCRDGRDIMSLHHQRCEHYTPPSADPRYARLIAAAPLMLEAINYVLEHPVTFVDNTAAAMLEAARDAALGQNA